MLFAFWWMEGGQTSLGIYQRFTPGRLPGRGLLLVNLHQLIWFQSRFNFGSQTLILSALLGRKESSKPPTDEVTGAQVTGGP